jgi:hypothetical protein
MQITPTRARSELEAQHAGLRGMMQRCIELADELDAGRCGPTQLLREIARLRLAFESHNRFEEELLRPALQGANHADAALLEQLRNRHIEEHRSLRTRLANAGTPATQELRQVIETMRAHLDHEELVLLNGLVVRDDAVAVDG